MEPLLLWLGTSPCAAAAASGQYHGSSGAEMANALGEREICPVLRRSGARVTKKRPFWLVPTPSAPEAEPDDKGKPAIRRRAASEFPQASANHSYFLLQSCHAAIKSHSQ